MKKNKVGKVIAVMIFVLLVATVIGSAVYVNDYYRTDAKAEKSLQSTDEVKVKQLNHKTLVFEPQNAKAGIIFYPGGKVEYTAYAPLLNELAKQGVLGILVKMPGNLAVLDTNAADGLKKFYPEIDEWYMEGHSLGGSMGASYLGKHANDYTGLILLAAYSTVDLSDTSLKVMTSSVR